MGCGASICNNVFGPSSQKARRGSGSGRLPLLPSGSQYQNSSTAAGLVTPPGNRSRLQQGHLGKKGGLRIDTAIASREKAGLAETPIGKAADEYKYYCPLCMMFFRSICELPCCKQSTCAFCFAEYIERNQKQKGGGSAPAGATALAADDAVASPPAPVKGGVPLLLPAGTACPQCAVVAKKQLDLRVIEGYESAHVAYIDSPHTLAEQARVKEKQQGRAGMASPLKVGDDFNAMARKMLPFQNIEVIDEAAQTTDSAGGTAAADSTSKGGSGDESATSASGSGEGVAAAATDAAAPASANAGADSTSTAVEQAGASAAMEATPAPVVSAAA